MTDIQLATILLYSGSLYSLTFTINIVYGLSDFNLVLPSVFYLN